MDWRPIESAPKDGTRVLLDMEQETDSVQIGAWHEQGWAGPAWYLDNGEKSRAGWLEPCGWMPLPAPLPPSPTSEE